MGQVSQRGVLDMIYERDQQSKESRKSSAKANRHSILNDYNNADGDFKVDSDSFSNEASSARRPTANQVNKFLGLSNNEDLFRNQQELSSLKEAANTGSIKSLGQASQGTSSKKDVSDEAANLSDQDGLLD